jgi:hypothetical protein
MKLTRSNYHSRKANLAHFSASQIKSFLECPARAMAELSGEYIRPESAAFLVGSYVDAYFDGKKAFEKFETDNPGIFKRDGSLKSEYVRADEMIARAEQDRVFMEFMRGRKQVIRTGFIMGHPFKIKMDVYKKGQRIVDLKTVKDFAPMYKPEQGRVSFAEFWNWPLQMAIYQAVEGDSLPIYLACITKEAPPDIAVIEIPQHHLDAEMDVLTEKLPYFDAIKSGIIEPERCERCSYCRQSKRLAGAVSLDDFTEF